MTSIALRVAYSVIDDCCATRPKDGMEAAATTAGKKISYEEFATEVLAECKFRWDEETFRGIVAALRAVLAWDGPMFIALDDFEQAYQHKLKKIGEGLRHVSTELLMSDKALPIRCNANKQHVKLYETYLAVSPCSVADLVAAAPRIGQEQIMQPMPMFDVRNIDTLFAHDSAGMIPSQYASLFNHGPRHLSNEQLLFLIHVFLCAGRPRALSDCLEGHAHDVPGVSFFHLTQQWHDRIIWLRRGVAQLPSARTMKWNFFDACKLVVGLDAETVFSDDDEYHFMDERRRHFVLARDLEEDFVVTQAPTRVLVSLRFLSSIVNNWRPKDNKHSVRRHCEDLLRILVAHADLTLAIVKAGPEFVRDQHNPCCVELIGGWYETIQLGFEDLTFLALCLRFACALADERVCDRMLSREVFSHPKDTELWSREYKRGPLVRVENVANFPSMFFDAYSGSDAAKDKIKQKHLQSNCSQALWSNIVVPAANRSLEPVQLQKSSYEHLQAALANGDHFCFQPRNPNNHCEDGVMFLREDTTRHDRKWTVLLIANERLGDDTEPVIERAATGRHHVVDEWRGNVAHMPAVLVDSDGNTHHFQYARILITADSIGKNNFEDTTATAASEESSLFAEANAAFIHMLKTNTRDEIESKVRSWANMGYRPPPSCEVVSCGGECSAIDAAERFPPSDAISRAKMIVSTMQHYHEHCMEAAQRGEEMSQPLPLKHGKVVSEYSVDLDTISKWCPTVGVFVGNLARIRQLASSCHGNRL